VALALD
ncbi:hypothetical protein MKD33_03210, partial [Chromobacterium piscinae]